MMVPEATTQQQFLHNEYPPVALAVIENKFGEVLIEEKSPDKLTNGFAGLPFVFPGGKLDPGELPVQAVVREVWEETRMPLRGQIVVPVAHVRKHPVSGKEIFYFYWFWPFGRPPELTPEKPHIKSLLWVPKLEIFKYMPMINQDVRRVLNI